MGYSQNPLRISLPSRVIVLPIALLLLASFRFDSLLFAQEPGSVSLEPGKDRGGYNYSSFITDAPHEACQNACASDTNCQAYTWVRPGVKNPQAVCYLKDTVPEASGNPDCVSGVKLLLPQGLTGGLSYWRPEEVKNVGIVDKTATLNPQGGRQAKSGWQTLSDGDIGAKTDQGFYHQELTSQGGGITSQTPDRFMLPAGTACGFHHTTNSSSSCMGIDPGANKCPNGWIARRHFDMSSGDGNADCLGGFFPQHCGYFVWCEYTDPHKLCEDSDCVQSAVGFASVGIKSNTDPTGDTLRFGCPTGTGRTSFYDMGRGEGQGLSFCLYSYPWVPPGPFDPHAGAIPGSSRNTTPGGPGPVPGPNANSCDKWGSTCVPQKNTCCSTLSCTWIARERIWECCKGIDPVTQTCGIP